MRLLERDDQLGRLTELLESAREGHGSVALIRGEAGVGKTVLVQKFLDDVANQAHVLWGACEDMVAAVPFGPLWDMSASDDELGVAVGNGDRVATFTTVLDRLSRSLRPTVAVIEDAQWADEATLDLIRVVGRRASKTHGLLILTLRDDHVAAEHPLRHVIGSIPPDSLERIILAPLSRGGVANLVGPQMDVDHIFRLTGGNPFFVTEIVRHPGEEIPSSVADAVSFWVSTLDDEGRKIAELVSVMPGGAEIDLLLGIDSGAEKGIAECERTTLLQVDRERVSFRHELSRLAVEVGLSTVHRRRLNRDVLRALEAAGGEPGRCAHHAHEAGDVNALVRHIPNAAQRAAEVGSSREAVALLHLLEPHLGDLGPEAVADHYDLLVGQGMLIDDSELIDNAQRAVALRRELGDRAALGRTLLMAGEAAFVEGQPVMATELTDEALDVLGPADGELLALAQARRARLATRAGDYGMAVELGRKSLDLSAESPNRSRVQALLYLGNALGETRFPEGIEELIEAYTLSDRLGLPDEQIRAAGSLSIIYWRHRDIDLAEEWINTGLKVLDTADLPMLEDWLRIGLAFSAEARGQWDSALAQAAQIYSNANRRDHLVTSGILLAKIHTRRGSSEAGRLIANVSAVAAEKADLALMAHIAPVAVEKAWLDGDVESEPVDDAISLLSLISDREPPWMWAELAMWLHVAGRLSHVDHEVPDPWRALLEGDWSAAAASWLDRGMPYEQSLALQEGDVPARFEALRILDGLGAPVLAAKVRKSLQAEGVKGIPRGPYKGRRSNPLGLTTRQVEILELVAEELSNAEIADRLFLSVRTVEQHVSSILATLSAANRREAVRIAMDSSLVPTRDSQLVEGIKPKSA